MSIEKEFQTFMIGSFGISDDLEKAFILFKLVKALQSQLDEANKVIEFYGSAENWKYPGNDFADFYIDWSDLSNTERKNSKGKVAIHKCGGKRARAYQSKYLKKEEA